MGQEDNQSFGRKGFFPKDPSLHLRVLELQARSLPRSLFAFLLDWAVIVAMAAASWLSFLQLGVTAVTSAFYALALVVIGSRQKGLENLIHEATHGNLCDNRKLNDSLAVLLGGVWMAPGWHPASERPGHVGGHHGHFGDPERDLETYSYRNLGLADLPGETLGKSLKVFLLAFAKTTWWRVHNQLRMLPVIIAILIGAWLLQILLPFFLYWLAPYFLIYMPMRFFAEVSEHSGMGISTEFTSTRNKLGWIQQYVIHPHGDGFHLVHHLYPSIPHYNLAKAHRILMEDPAYREGNHFPGLLFAPPGQRTTFSDLLVPTQQPER